MSNSNNGKQTDGVNLIFVEQQKTYLRKEAINQSKGSLAQKLESIKQNGFRLSVLMIMKTMRVLTCVEILSAHQVFFQLFRFFVGLLFCGFGFVASFLSVTVYR